MFGTYQARGLYGCRFWDMPRHPLAPPMLVIGTVHDPATPYQGAIELSAALGNGVPLTWEGEGHTAYLRSPCVDRIADDYLVALTAPEAGKRCPA